MSYFQLTPDAKASLMQIAIYTQTRWGEKQRHIYMKMLDDCFHLLSKTPMRGMVRPDIFHTLRSYPAAKHIVFYIIKSDHIVIVNVLHERMDPAKHLHSRHKE